ncbi:MAG: helix-turn-helix domain-containing protein [Gemmataceae bacterium]
MPNGVVVNFDAEALRPLIDQVVQATLASVREADARLPDRLAYSEEEAARLIGLAPHQLRDERLRGRIASSKIVGGRVRYQRNALLEYLAAGKNTAAK